MGGVGLLQQKRGAAKHAPTREVEGKVQGGRVLVREQRFAWPRPEKPVAVLPGLVAVVRISGASVVIRGDLVVQVFVFSWHICVWHKVLRRYSKLHLWKLLERPLASFSLPDLFREVSLSLPVSCRSRLTIGLGVLLIGPWNPLLHHPVCVADPIGIYGDASCPSMCKFNVAWCQLDCRLERNVVNPGEGVCARGGQWTTPAPSGLI
jgi:hypothetical protein